MSKVQAQQSQFGFFSEPTSFTTVGDPYHDPSFAPGNPSVHKGKQFIVGGPKKNTGLQDGYFSKTYTRVLEGEAYYDAVKAKRKEIALKKEKNVAGPFKPSNGTKSNGGPGNYTNTFGGKMEHFAPVTKEAAKPPKEPKNFLTNPPKKGGPGYKGMGIGKDPDYVPSPYDAAAKLEKEAHLKHKEKMRGPLKLGTKETEYFTTNPFTDPNGPKPVAEETKKPEGPKPKPFMPTKKNMSLTSGGKYLGTFETYPAHVDEPPPEKKKTESIAKPFKANIPGRSMCTPSIASKYLNKSINARNYSTL